MAKTFIIIHKNDSGDQWYATSENGVIDMDSRLPALFFRMEKQGWRLNSVNIQMSVPTEIHYLLEKEEK